jgi:hypothetical protein
LIVLLEAEVRLLLAPLLHASLGPHVYMLGRLVVPAVKRCPVLPAAEYRDNLAAFALTSLVRQVHMVSVLVL